MIIMIKKKKSSDKFLLKCFILATRQSGTLAIMT